MGGFMAYEKYLEIALDCAKYITPLFKEGFQGLNSVEWKSASDPVTAHDKKIEKMSREFILSKCPDHIILGEEDGLGENTDSAFKWIIDPIDGTINYIRGISIVSYSLALSYKDEIVVAVISNPILEEYFWAVRGGGAFLNGNPISVNNCVHLKHCYLILGSYNEKYSDIFHKYISQFQCVRNLGSAALALAYVASGRVNGLLYFHLSPWDIAAGILLVTEAGGRVNNINSDNFSLGKPSIVASAPEIHDTITSALRNIEEFD